MSLNEGGKGEGGVSGVPTDIGGFRTIEQIIMHVLIGSAFISRGSIGALS